MICGAPRVAFALAALLATAQPVGAQGFSIKLERGEIGVDGRGLRQVQGTMPGSGTTDYQEWFRLPVSGWFMHPRVMRYALSFRPLLGQHGGTTLDRSTRNHSLGMDLSTALFPERRASLAVQLTNSTGGTQGAFGTSSDFQNSFFSSTLTLRDRYFPSSLSYSRRSVNDRWSSAFTAAPILRDQQTDKLRLEVRNRTLNTILERSSYEDRQGHADHQALNGALRHRTEWGKGSSLVSAFNLYRRTGTNAIGSSNWSEQLSIAHTGEVTSSYRFARQTWNRSGQSGRNVALGGVMRYRSAGPLEGALSLSRQSFRSGTGAGSARTRIEPSLRYLLELPLGARLSTSVSGGFERLRRSMQSESWVDVLEERHEIESTRHFSLDQLRVDPESIEIWNEDRSLLLEEGVDYWLVQTGSHLDVQIPPGSRVAEGEIVLVNYRFQAMASEGMNLHYVNYETSLRIDGLTLRHGRRQRSEEGGTAGAALSTQRDDVDLWYGASFARRTLMGHITVGAFRRDRRSREVEYRSDELRGDVTFPRVLSLEGRLRVSTSRTTSTDQVTRSTSAGAQLAWPISRAMRVSARVDGWMWDQEGEHVERFLTGGLQLSWRFAQVTTLLSYDQIRRWNAVDQTEHRWSFRVVRRF